MKSVKYIFIYMYMYINIYIYICINNYLKTRLNTTIIKNVKYIKKNNAIHF
jgi:hypothetical protein